MEFTTLHRWDLTPTDAIALQRQLAARVEVHTAVDSAEFIAGCDVSYNRFSPIFYAAIVVLRTSDHEIVEIASAVGKSPFPYIPGLLSFREMPILLQAFAKLQQRPDILMVDGMGIAHPRRLGIAAHLGLWLDLPTIGCGKSRLCGTFSEPGPTRGESSPLYDKDEIIGTVLRTKKRTKPLFISPGHRIDLPSSLRWVLAMDAGYRLPEPTRQAHLAVNALRRANSK